MGTTLFSLRNELQPAGGQASYLELNPAVVSGEDCERFALAAVYIDAGGEDSEGPLSMRIVCDSTSAMLLSVGERTEPIDSQRNLTVALFSVSRAFLEKLAWARKVEVQLGTDVHTVTRQMAPANRANVGQFLASLDAHQAAVQPAVAAGAVA
jgi:hypothetical protein